jgi:putative DNA primase/helicase
MSQKDRIKHQARARIKEELRFADKSPRRNDTSTKEGFLLDCVKSGQIGDAQAFTSLFKGRFCYDHASNRWYQWQEHYWKEDAVSNVVAAVDQLIEAYGEEAKKWAWRRIKAKKQKDEDSAKEAEKNEETYLKKIAKLQDKTYRLHVLYLSAVGENSLGISGEKWDSNPNLIACLNGVLDLEKGEFRPGRPEDYIKTPCPTEWLGEDEPAPRWCRFLEEIFGGDIDLIAYVKRLLGYGIIGTVIHHILIILWGIGRNGKGTLLEILKLVLGANLASPIQAELLLEQRNRRSSSAPSPDIMALRGKRIVWASETDEGRKLNAGKIKWLTGGDTLVGRDPYGKREVPFLPSHLLFLLTNFKPKVNAADFGLWERIHLIPFKFCFVENPIEPHHRKADYTLLEELKKEASGILACLVQGFREYKERGLKPPPAVIQAVEQYRKEEDDVGLFITDCCFLAPNAKAKGEELYDAYKKWCDREGRKLLSGVKFGEQLKAKFEWKKKGVIIYFGIGLLA